MSAAAPTLAAEPGWPEDAVEVGIVVDAWGLKKREVQKIIADNGVTALAMLPKFAVTPEELLRNCERHARGIRRDRRQSGGVYRRGLTPAASEPPSHR